MTEPAQDPTHRLVGGGELVELLKKLLTPDSLGADDFYLARYNSLVSGAWGDWKLTLRAEELLRGVDPLAPPVPHGLSWLDEGIYYRGYVLTMTTGPRPAGARTERRTWLAFRVGCQDPEGYTAKRSTKSALKRRVDEIVRARALTEGS